MDTVGQEQVHAAIDDLLRRLRNGAEGIENESLEDYLEAMNAWLEGYQRKYKEPLTWGLVAEMLTAASIYE